MNHAKPLTIAIDGPAASGKGTLARRLATHYSLPHLDTGLTYRAVAKALLDAGAVLDDEAVAAETAARLDLSCLDRDVLSDHKIGEAASQIAVFPAVRRALVEAQQRFARSGNGAVLDGRDIGSVVLPDAAVKLFVTATPGIRAGRRYEEIIQAGGEAVYDDILADIRIRDERDMNRADSPLKPTPDAHLLDTSDMSIDDAFHEAMTITDRALMR